jgi:hypothetical protein
MRGFGWTLFVLGAGGLFWALNLDTTVGASPYYSEDRWVFPRDRYHNIGLLNEKQNYTIAAGVVAVVGVLLVIVGGSRAPTRPAEPAGPAPATGAAPGRTKKCPDCAEIIQLEAKICRFCTRQFTDHEVQAQRAQATSSPNQSV